jgi:di/tricarboxylate transporter
MFGALISDRIGADSVMLTALTAFAAAEIINLSEALEGFSNEGLMTVMVLFIVAEGISKTGALDWYMSKLLGRPSTPASAQMRLMAPIAIVSAFLNNTPVVAVMIPIVQRWAKNIKMSPQQLLIPLSFASILGGTCTLIGTSTNLVVEGLLKDRYPDDESISIGLFDLGQYGVPVAMAGIIYVLLASPVLLPGGRSDSDGEAVVPSSSDDEDLLLGARLTQWSPAAGRTVRRSGLRETGGIYLVSVHRAATGNVHRAVSQDFVLQVGDILYFTGFVEGFGAFCDEHGLELLTNEVQENEKKVDIKDDRTLPLEDAGIEGEVTDIRDAPRLVDTRSALSAITENEGAIPLEIGVTKESLVKADTEERIRSIHRMTDKIHKAQQLGAQVGQIENSIRTRGPRRLTVEGLAASDPTKIVVTVEKDLVVVGINAHDRPGLLLDISKGLLRLDLELHHTEAAVVAERSISVWRCQPIGTELPDLEEIWSIMNALLSTETGVEAVKQRGLRVIRAKIIKGSRLAGITVAEVNFRQAYKAAIVAIQRKEGGNVSTNLSQVRLSVGDVLILQVSDDSPILVVPPEDFYKNLKKEDEAQQAAQRHTVASTFVSLIRRRSSGNLESMGGNVTENALAETDANIDPDDTEVLFQSGKPNLEVTGDEEAQLRAATSSSVEVSESSEFRHTQLEKVWRDLQVMFQDDSGMHGEVAQREFLTAMTIAPFSKLAGKTVAQAGINKLPEIFLVSIDRPVQQDSLSQRPSSLRGGNNPHGSEMDMEGSVRTDNVVFKSIDPADPLQEGDVLWFSGSASAVGDLRKIPGLLSYQNEEVLKINEKVHDRRLVQAVIARKGPLVGKTVKEVRFRTRYGAAVIAVHREGKRVHELPGKIKLQAGDVLLLEAGPTFIEKSSENDRSFALLAEVENSAPPRLSSLIPALLITAGMLVVFTAGLTSLLISALVAAVLMVSFGILSEQEARDAVNWDVYITIASAFGIGTALVNSGVAESVANFLVDIGTAVGIGDAGLYGAVYFATFLISNVVTNNAAAALLFPIALDAAEQTGTNRILMSYALMLGASASFMSPFGYTTNLLIYGPGGYKYRDFLVFGSPMQIILWVLSVAFLVIEPWYISWIVSAVTLIFVLFWRVVNSSLSRFLNQSKRTGANPSRAT